MPNFQQLGEEQILVEAAFNARTLECYKAHSDSKRKWILTHRLQRKHSECEYRFEIIAVVGRGWEEEGMSLAQAFDTRLKRM